MKRNRRTEKRGIVTNNINKGFNVPFLIKKLYSSEFYLFEFLI
jgi:hypothetical protein